MNILRIIFPLIGVSVAIVIIISYLKRKEERQSADENTKEPDNYMSEGVALGLCLGTALGVAIDRTNFVYWIGPGMIIGLVIGMNIEKKI